MQYEGLDRLFICNVSVADLLTVKRYIKRNKWENVTKADMVALDADIEAILRVVRVGEIKRIILKRIDFQLDIIIVRIHTRGPAYDKENSHLYLWFDY